MYLRNWQRTISALMCLCLATNLIGPSALLAGSNGPGAPGAAVCSGGNDARGPCTDPGTFTSVGIGNGLPSGNVVWIYAGGTCAGTDNFSGNNCNECTSTPKIITYTYTSIPVGTFEMASCDSLLKRAFPIQTSACATSCTTDDALTITSDCLECIENEGELGAAVVEAYRECVGNRDFTGFVTGNAYATACN